MHACEACVREEGRWVARPSLRRCLIDTPSIFLHAPSIYSLYLGARGVSIKASSCAQGRWSCLMSSPRPGSLAVRLLVPNYPTTDPPTPHTGTFELLDAIVDGAAPCLPASTFSPEVRCIAARRVCEQQTDTEHARIHTPKTICVALLCLLIELTL